MAFWAALPIAGQMPGQGKMNVKFETFPVANPASVVSLKLVRAGGSRLILCVQGQRGTELSLADIERPGDAPRPLMGLGDDAEAPLWDAVGLKDGSITAVWTVAGSSILGLS